MPTYTFRRPNGEVFTDIVSLADYDKFVEDNQLERVWNGAPKIVSGVNAKPSDGFRDMLKQIHKNAGKQSKINTY